MKCVVTGGAGFIGSHLVEQLIKQGHEVSVLDNLSTGHREYCNNCFFEQVDLSTVCPSLDGVDVVFHLAALADIVPSIDNPIKYYNSNVTSTINVLEESRKSKVRKFIYAASASCYGIPQNIPVKETDYIDPKYPYALTKYLGEQLVLHWGKVYKMPVVSLRLFNVYGPRSRTTGAYGAVFGIFLTQLYYNKPLTIVGDGYQTRDFIYVSDVIDAFVKAANYGGNENIFNIGTGKQNTINYLADMLGGKERIFIPERPNEPKYIYADISKAKDLLEFVPKISFEEGIKIMKDNIECWGTAPLWTPETIKEATKGWFDCFG